MNAARGNYEADNERNSRREIIGKATTWFLPVIISRENASFIKQRREVTTSFFSDDCDLK